MPAGRHRELLQVAVGARDRGDRRLRAVAVREVIVVGQREQQEVVQVVALDVGADASGVGVARARARERRLAVDLLRGYSSP